MESGRWTNKFRIITIALIFSGALNIGLLAACAFSAFSKINGAADPVQALGKPAELANRQLLLSMCKLSFPELLTYLTNRERVEEGYAKRDLALSALVACHHFNLEKALSALPSQRRLLALSEEQTIEMYPALTDEEYDALIRFAYQEKWPLTAKGVFQLLKKWPKNTRDPSLEQAFFVTPEFRALHTLFQKTHAAQENAVLLDLLCEGSWDLLERFVKEQAQACDLSVDKRRSLLQKYMAAASPAAAFLLVKTDAAFARLRFEDRDILSLLRLLKEKSPEAERFCKELLLSPRSDAVWRAAGERLYAYAGEEPPAAFDSKSVIARFAPSPPAIPKAALPPKAAALCEYTVKDGDTLWKIARQHKVKVEELRECNGLIRERLVPGMKLCIPQGTGSEPPQ